MAAMTPQASQTAPLASGFSHEHFHPLEMIPFFRRFPPSFGRDFLYTFIWSSFSASPSTC
jgi:hypothetical protein